jgi:hypothetical protein
MIVMNIICAQTNKSNINVEGLVWNLKNKVMECIKFGRGGKISYVF